MRNHTRKSRRKGEDLKNLVHRWALKIGVEPTRVQVQRMTTKWASCSPSGRICLSRDLVREDVAFQQIVIVHELLHLRVPNHGRLFKSLMAAYLPRWDEIANGRVRSVCGYGLFKSQEDRGTQGSGGRGESGGS